jgi:hypothetical protein
MGNPLGIVNFGAFTNLTAATIAAQLAAAGFATTGNIYYLDPANGNDNWNGQTPIAPANQSINGVGPVQSLTAGYNLLVSGHNDVLVLIGNGTTTATARMSITTTFTWSKNAAHLVGISAPSRFSMRSRLAPITTGTGFAGPQLTVSGNGCFFANLEIFQGYATGVANQINVKITGSRNVFHNCQISGMGDTTSAASAGSRSLLITSGENFFQHCVIGLDTISRGALNASVEFQSGAARNVFEDCVFPCLASTAAAGLAVLVANADGIDRITQFTRCIFYNASAFSGGSAGTGVMKLVASAGGAILLDPACVEYGYTDWGYDAASKAEILVSGPVPTSSSSGIAVVNT